MLLNYEIYETGTTKILSIAHIHIFMNTYKSMLVCSCALMKIQFMRLEIEENLSMCRYVRIICIKKIHSLVCLRKFAHNKICGINIYAFSEHSSHFAFTLIPVPSLWIYVWLNILCLKFVNWRNNIIRNGAINCCIIFNNPPFYWRQNIPKEVHEFCWL